ncbi:transporter substrate-binding domain-containing protein [Marinisporobacter balticus]|uniref:Amino acid ABC transporter substrate-binding protein (PAAT family) n=1 Tax=Marinisporobacter balticus TaxID=2018667 RepID=A0A4R2LF78_9FIRM|nr:transporter substrate-binding domain-containing protein [Marinisporobacter balticus]TCO77915.1 amino acid ABC transporter substrate-binding protein (PAAT family) [Marinisporobacter balticus]
MKKIFTVSLLICMILSMTACGSKKNEEPNEVKSDIPTKIIVASGASSVPNTYIENGEHKGHEVDIWNAISEKTGLKVEFITGEFNTLFGYLDSGKADTVGNTITINAKRQDKYDFSEPYAYIPEKLVVHSDRTDLKKLKDISGMTCGFSAGSNGGNLFEKIAEEQEIDINLVTYDSSELLNEAFRQGKVEVMLFAGAEAAYKIKNGIIDARMVDEDIAVGAKAYPFVKGNTHSEKLNEMVTKAIQEMKKDGTLSEIYDKWYGMDFSENPEDGEIAN